MPETLPQPSPTPDDRVRARPRRRVARGSLALAVLLVLAVVLAACGSDSPAGVTVGSTSVSESTVQGQLDAIAKNATIKAQAVKDGKLDPGVVGSWLTALVETEVAKQAVQKAGTKVTKADKAAAQSWADGYFGNSSAFAAFPKSFRSEALARYAYVPAFVRTHTKTPTETELRANYDQSLARICSSRRYISRILLTSEAAANAAAAEVAAGQDFGQVAAKESSDQVSAQRGGAIGCIDQQQLDPEFTSAAAATPVGSVSKPVHTQSGWFIIKVQDVGQALPYDSVKSEIRTDLVEQGPAGRKALVKLMAAAKVEVAKRFGTWQVKDGQGSVQPPTTTTTTKPAGSSTTRPAGGTTTTTG
jgi:parvulin-like peptidyl-prolyl isomerase